MDTKNVRWIKSSYSGGSGTECVEVATLAALTAVRDSTVPDGPHVAVQHAAWASFVHAVQHGQFSVG